MVDARTGDLLAPVRGELFDLVVSNPPFVIGPGRDTARYTYRDGGRDGDDLCRSLVADLPRHLVEDGTAVLLANWLHVEGEDGDARVQSWFGPDVDGWVVQRELAAPEDYVTAWLRDTDEGSRFDELYDAWLDWFEQRRVEAVAFGILALRRGQRPGRTSTTCRSRSAAAWGEEVAGVLRPAGARWTGGCWPRPWRLRDDVRLHQVARPTEDGWYADAQVLQQERGLRWSGGVDVYGATLLAGCDGSRRLGDLLRVLASSAGLTEAEAAEQVLPGRRAARRAGLPGRRDPASAAAVTQGHSPSTPPPRRGGARPCASYSRGQLVGQQPAELQRAATRPTPSSRAAERPPGCAAARWRSGHAAPLSR